MMKRTVAVIGAGKVGSVLAKAFHKRGYELVGIASRTLESASKLAKEFDVVATTKAADITHYADIILIATPDRCIGQVVEEVVKDGGFRAGQFVFHTSGGVPVEVLSPASHQGVYIGGMHPLQSFADEESLVDTIIDSYFALGGDEQATILAGEIVRAFGGKSFIISDKDRPLYHGAACIVSNYFVSLMHWATQIYTGFGLSPGEASAALMPLVQGTVSNLKHLGPTQALTGPISRGDISTIAAHLAGFNNEQEKNLYAQLGRYTLGIALEKGSINEEQASRLKELLTCKMERVS